MMIWIIVLGLILALFVGPTLWVSYILKKHATQRLDFPGTGGEFARHLLDRLNLPMIPVEEIPSGDHYDPQEKAVHLSEEYYNGKSLTAIVVAAHEVGHAIQDRDKYAPLVLRTRLAEISYYTEMLAKGILIIAPFSSIFSPRLMLLSIIIFIGLMLFRVLFQLVTLPVEFDASFNKALPVLLHGDYIPKQDIPAARRILQACAMTYVAATLVSIVDIMRWFRFLR